MTTCHPTASLPSLGRSANEAPWGFRGDRIQSQLVSRVRDLTIEVAGRLEQPDFIAAVDRIEAAELLGPWLHGDVLDETDCYMFAAHLRDFARLDSTLTIKAPNAPVDVVSPAGSTHYSPRAGFTQVGSAAPLLSEVPATFPTVQLAPGLARAIAARVVEQGVENSSEVRVLTFEDGAHPELLESVRGLLAAWHLLEIHGLDSIVGGSLRHVVLLTTDEAYTGRYSASSPDAPGTACLDARGPLIDLVDALVHEAAHLAFYEAEQAFPTVTRVKALASPFRTGPRTVRRVLSGADAFANAAAALRIVAHSVADSTGMLRRADALDGLADDALELLRTDDTLSDAGRAWVATLDARPRPTGSRSPWSHLPSIEPIHDRAVRTLVDAEPYVAESLLGTVVSEARRLLIGAHRRREGWALHPATLALADPAPDIGAVIAALEWVATHTPWGAEVCIDRPLEHWWPTGRVSRCSGDFPLGTLIVPPGARPEIDPYGTMAGAFLGETEVFTSADERSVRTQELRTTMEFMSTNVPAIYDWVAHVVAVAVPLPTRDPSRSRSFSVDGRFGIVFVESHLGTEATGEALVHEAAHLHLAAEDAASPLVAIGHDRLYWSPLREDPRPLRGVLLAYHALAHIGAYYGELAAATGSSSAVAEEALARELVGATESVLEDAAAAGLTVAGRRFFQRTREILGSG